MDPIFYWTIFAAIIGWILTTVVRLFKSARLVLALSDAEDAIGKLRQQLLEAQEQRERDVEAMGWANNHVAKLASAMWGEQEKKIAIRDAANAFLAKFDELLPSVDAAFGIAHIHGYKHTAGNWTKELANLRTTLKEIKK